MDPLRFSDGLRAVLRAKHRKDYAIFLLAPCRHVPERNEVQTAETLLGSCSLDRRRLPRGVRFPGIDLCSNSARSPRECRRSKSARIALSERRPPRTFSAGLDWSADQNRSASRLRFGTDRLEGIRVHLELLRLKIDRIISSERRLPIVRAHRSAFPNDHSDYGRLHAERFYRIRNQKKILRSPCR